VAQDRVALLASGNEHAIRGGLLLLLLPLLYRCTKLLLLLLYRCTMLLLLLLLLLLVWQHACCGAASAIGGGLPPRASVRTSGLIIEIATGPRRELKPASIRHFAPGCALLAGQFVITRLSN
jgi:hypothetical protein